MARNFQSLKNRYISATACSILLKFGTEFEHLTTDTLQSFKIKGSKAKVTAWRGISSKKVRNR